jgi:hypothetical protein
MLVGSLLIQATGGSSEQTINVTILYRPLIIVIKSDYYYAVVASDVRECRLRWWLVVA